MNCKTEKDRNAAALKENFDVNILGPIRHHLGMKVTHTREKGIIMLNQE
jgi:hypothetical protein